MIESRCGIQCSACAYRESTGCAGCTNREKPFWGSACPVKSCCEGKNLTHCGLCPDFPCDVLRGFAYDPQQGDNGARLVQCQKWREEAQMASSLSYVEFVLEQMSGAGTITYRRMFGEYGLYCDGKYFGVICGGRALVKRTPAGEALLPDCPRGIPYEGGGEMLVPDVEDRETLVELVRVTCAALPEKKPRKKEAK